MATDSPSCLLGMPQLKGMRKEVAELLRSNKQESARIRVEAVIRENALLQAYDVLELFLELLAVRVQLVERSKDVPPDMIEALASLVYSAQRVQAGCGCLLPCTNTALSPMHSRCPVYMPGIVFPHCHITPCLRAPGLPGAGCDPCAAGGQVRQRVHWRVEL